MIIDINKILKEQEEFDLGNAIRNDEINIVFGDPNTIGINLLEESFSIPKDKSNSSIYIYIRNKYLDGSNGQPIHHECTVKLIKNNIYKYDGKKGVPFKVEPKIELDVDYKIDKKDEKYAKSFIKDNKKDILAYWYAKDTIEGRKQMNDIKTKLCKKYGVKINEYNE